MPELRVRTCYIDGERLYGVTNGEKWFFYAYTTSEAAQEMCVTLTPSRFYTANVTHPQAYKRSEATAGEIRENR